MSSNKLSFLICDYKWVVNEVAKYLKFTKFDGRLCCHDAVNINIQDRGTVGLPAVSFRHEGAAGVIFMTASGFLVRSGGNAIVRCSIDQRRTWDEMVKCVNPSRIWQMPGKGRPLYHLSWLDSCLEETLLPGKPWHKVYNRLGAALAHELQSQQRDSPQSQPSWELLGGHFIQTFLPALADQTWNSCPEGEGPAVEAEIRRLDSLCRRAAESSRCQWNCDGGHDAVCQEMMDFVNDTYNLVASEMEQILAAAERNHQEGEELHLAEAESAWAMTAGRRPQSVESRHLHLSMRKSSAYWNTDAEPGAQHAGPAPPPLHCVESKVLGGALAVILTSDPSRMQQVCERLGGRLLTASLRDSVWIDKLLRLQASSSDSTWGLERRVRERFGRAVERRTAALKLRSATRSPISGLIETAVVEAYEQTPCMQAFATNEQMISESCKALNILYVHSGVYLPCLVHWLFPLQIAFQQPITKAEHSYELAMYLHLLLQRFLPSGEEVLDLAESVMRLLRNQDPQLHAHLQHCTSQNAVLDPQDYAVMCLAQEREKVLEALDVPGSSDRHLAATREVLENPAIFLRKWIGEGLVGVLDLPAVLLVWDQLFMQDWSRRVMEDFCLALLLLLREALLSAGDYPGMREVLLGHACHLFTADIQRAWVHLQQGGLVDDIPGFNRLGTRFLDGPFPPEAAPHESDPQSLDQILPLGLKDINLCMILDLPKKGHFHQASLEDFDPCSVSLTASVVYGNVNLHSKSTLLKPSVEVKSPRRETTPPEYRLRYSDVLHFDSLDLSDFREKLSNKDRPAVIFEVVYSLKENNGFVLMTLGWAKVDLFVEHKAGARTVWAPAQLTSPVPVLPGEVQENPWDHTLSQGPTGLLQMGSELQVTAFDPSREAQRLQQPMGNPSSEESPSLHPPGITHNPSLTVPLRSTVRQPFDLYIDSVHYIPDNATIIKVTGRFLRSGLKALPDIEAFPDPSSSARSPRFHFRLTVNPDSQTTFDPNTLLLLQVHTLCVDTGEPRIIGNCMERVFDNGRRLKAGGRQCRLRGGVPLKEELPHAESALQHQLTIPGTTVLFRLLPHEPDFVPAPDNMGGFYFTDGAKPNRSELEIMSSFQRDRGFPESVQEMVTQLAEKEEAHVPPEQASAWLEDRLHARKGGPSHQPPAHLPVLRMVRYRQQAGLRVRVTQAFGLPGGLYVNAFTRVLKGVDTFRVPELPQGWGGDEKFLTGRHDYGSLQRAPRWTDCSSVLHPYPDPHTVLLVQLFALDAVYRPDPSGRRCGTVSARARGQLGLDSKAQLAWTVIPLFEGPYVNSGVHYAPLFQSSPDKGFLRSVASCPVKEVTAGHLRSRTVKLWRGSASVAVQVWDGHYLDDERPDLPVLDSLLPADKKKKFLKTQNSRAGKELSQLVLQTLSRKARRKGRDSEEYQREEAFFEEAMGSTFYSLMETSLMNAGYGPL